MLARADRATLIAAALDYDSAGFSDALLSLKPDLVIHTSGPFQGQDYRVARACIDAGAHYVDLADGRAFVVGVAELDEAAKRRDVLIVSGASTLPALSSAVIDSLTPRHGAPRSVRISIAPGQRTPRGLATLRAVMSYCGRPFRVLQEGVWSDAYGWQDIHRHRYPEIGARWLSRCDVPDLELFPARYPTLTTVRFDAALEISGLQWGFWLMAWVARAGIVRDWSRYAPVLKPVGDAFNVFGSDRGGMHMSMAFESVTGECASIEWNLVAEQGHGPEIPCIPAIVVARKLARGELTARGAMPCMGLMSLHEFTAAISHLNIRFGVS